MGAFESVCVLKYVIIGNLHFVKVSLGVVSAFFVGTLGYI